MIEIISPAGFENFFRELADMVGSGAVDFGEVYALADRFGLRFGEPEWLPGVISRYGLTALPTQ